MVYLWMTSIAMLVGGTVLIAGKFIGLLDPIALVCGLLLLWSGIVKIVVLRIWRKSLGSSDAPSASPPRQGRFARSLFERRP